MNKQSFKCSAEQWNFSRTYSFIAVPDALTKPMKKTGMSWLALPALLFIIGAVASILFMHWIWIVCIALSFIVLLINYQRQSMINDAKYVEQFAFAEPYEKDVPFITVSSEKLLFHLFKPDGHISHQLKLNEIDGIAITMLNITSHTQKLPFLINKRAEHLGKLPAPLLYGRTDTYQMTIYSRQKALFQSGITIPSEWLSTDIFAKFIHCIQQQNSKPFFIEDTTAQNSLIKKYCHSYNIQLPTKRR